LHRGGVSYGRLSTVLALPKSSLAAKGRTRKKKGAPEKKVSSTDQELRLHIREIKARKPSWGIRRVRAWIRKVLGIPVGRKRIARLMREEGLLCPRLKKRAYRRLTPRSPANRPNQVWSMDMTQFLLSSGQKLFLVIVLDVFLRRIVGWHLSHRCRTQEWLAALDMALLAEFPTGSRTQGLTLRLDNGCQPTSNRFQDTLTTCGVNPEWTGYNSPKQNAHVERVIGTLKADWLWLHECDTFREAKDLVTKAIQEYNEEHPHSALAFLSPDEYRQAFYSGQININPNNNQGITLKAA
jgi:putative transposase